MRPLGDIFYTLIFLSNLLWETVHIEVVYYIFQMFQRPCHSTIGSFGSTIVSRNRDITTLLIVIIVTKVKYVLNIVYNYVSLNPKFKLKTINI